VGSSLEDGCEAYFGLSSLKRIDIRSAFGWEAMERQEQLDTNACGQPGSSSHRISGANRRVKVQLALRPPIPFASIESRLFRPHVKERLPI
jgi:hypothetical protein